jgi:threonine aldolase
VDTVDLRSDTLTRPSPGMRAAIATAEVGDDVYGEDPTVRALEDEVAAMFGHDAAVFVPTGTMGNQICLRLLAEPGQEVLCDSDAHLVTYELGAAAALGGLTTRTVPLRGAGPDPDDIAAQLRPPGFGTVVTAAVAIEQTHNRAGGAVYPLEALRRVREAATAAGARLHLDGARIWNASVASATPLEVYGHLADTLSVCLSKGLGAPVGSVVVTDAERRPAALALRKRLGGGMRQVGILAAAGRYALAHNLARLADDHARAARLASALGVDAPATNMVVLEVADAPAFAESARGEGVLVSVVGARRVRLVTHLDVDDAGVDRAGQVLARLLAGSARQNT